MGVDADLDGILREVVQFLECLREIDLPLKIENARENLLHRSKTKLSAIASCRVSASPEPYLDMNAGKGLLMFSNRKEIEIEEYVGVEEQTGALHPSRPDYYESFQEIGKTDVGKNDKNAETIGTGTTKTFGRDDEADEELLGIYKTFTPATTMNKAHKYGPLEQKVERKSFGFVRGNNRPCWIGLVGSHLLVYSSEKDKQPPEIYSMKGYTGRPTSKVILKDQDHSRSAFEIFCPGNKTLQFTAKTPKEMEEWLAAISRTTLIVQDRDSGMYERSMDEKIDAELSDHNDSLEERYQDVEGLLSPLKREETVVPSRANSFFDIVSGNKKIVRSNSEKKINPTSVLTTAPPPELPVRLVRRLPSLPNEETPNPSYEALADGYEEDDIYHKIEDFQDTRRSYENVKKKFPKRVKVKKVWKKKDDKNKKKIAETSKIEPQYSDENKKFESKKDESKNKQRLSLSRESPTKITEIPETYDDVRSIVRENEITSFDNSLTRVKDIRENFESTMDVKKNIRCSFATYDDVVQPPTTSTADPNRRTESFERVETDDVASTSTSPTKTPTKTSLKRSFLDRVRNRRDSPKKDDKKKCEIAMTSGKKSEKREKKKVSSEETSTSPCKTKEPETTMYDDVSGYGKDFSSLNASFGETELASRIDDFADYNYPPPPRPIYDEPPNTGVAVYANNDGGLIEDFYDDVGNCLNVRADVVERSTETKEIPENVGNVRTKTPIERLPKNDGKSVTTKNCENHEEIVKNNEDGFKTTISDLFDDAIKDEPTETSMEAQHYQIPRTEPLRTNRCTIDETGNHEQLYDDIAILAEFRSRPRQSGSSSNRDNSIFSSITSVDKLAIGVKKPWNRFGSGKKINSREISTHRETTKNESYSDLDDANDREVERNDATRTNKFKKLISKMETTLGKQTPTKSVNSLSNRMKNCE